ncbi:MAG TPA: catalase, partial [Leptospiraceae bacterium]|nr:catalase [Leptospiraceae bacterium]
MRKIRLFFSAAVAAAAALGCGGPYVKIPDSAELGKEYSAGRDDEIAKRTLELTLNSLKKKKADSPDSKVLRDAHPKHHGCTEASFTVEKNIPDALKHGIFKNPKTYSAYIRFSNGSQTPQADSI